MGVFDRVCNVYPFRNSNTAWRRAGFLNHKPLAGTPSAYDGWSLFVPVRMPGDGWKRTWVGANVLSVAGTPVAEFVTYAAGSDPEDPCEDVQVFYSPTASQAFAIRQDVPPNFQAGYDDLATPVYWGLDDGRRMMGGLEAERLQDCLICPEHPYDSSANRMAWLELTFILNGQRFVWDAMPSGCESIPAVWDGLFVPNIPPCAVGTPQKYTFADNPCPLTGGVYYYTNKWFYWEFCGWTGPDTFCTGTIDHFPAQCESDDEFVGGMFRISFVVYKQLSPVISTAGALGYDGLCNCGLWQEAATEAPHDECRLIEGFQHSYVYVGDEPCRPTASFEYRNTEDFATHCWGDDPAASASVPCDGGLMPNYSLQWSVRPS